jgi:hypothetical protein
LIISPLELDSDLATSREEAISSVFKRPQMY